jgi:hypothetical protein
MVSVLWNDCIRVQFLDFEFHLFFVNKSAPQ